MNFGRFLCFFVTHVVFRGFVAKLLLERVEGGTPKTRCVSVDKRFLLFHGHLHIYFHVAEVKLLGA